MGQTPEEERHWAVARVQTGETITAVAAALRRSRRWLYTWLARARTGDPGWAADRSHRPAQLVQGTSPAIVEAVRLVRLSLYNRGLLCGAQNIRWELEELAVTPLPAIRTINRILAREGLTHRRTGRYLPKGKQYPALAATAPVKPQMRCKYNQA